MLPLAPGSRSPTGCSASCPSGVGIAIEPRAEPDAGREQHDRAGGGRERAQDEPARRRGPPAPTGPGDVRRHHQRRRLGAVPGVGRNALELAHHRPQPLDLLPQRGVGGHRALERRDLRVVELTEQVGDGLAHRSSSSALRIRLSPLTMRDFTVPSGTPVAAAISVWLCSR